VTGVVVIGDVINDVVVRPERDPVSDTDTASAIESVPGGSGANQAAWLASMGVATRLSARVGAADAHVHRAALLAAGVDARLAEDADRSTGSIVILIDTEGNRTMFTDRGANRALGPDDVPVELLAGMTHLHISGYSLIEPASRAAVSTLWEAAGASGLTRSADPGSVGFLSLLGPDTFLNAARGADALFPNGAEARLLAGTDDARRAALQLADSFPLIALKEGEDGAAIVVAGEVLPVPAQAVTVIDPTGSGDAFAAGFLAAWLNGSDPFAAMTAAVATAARAIQQVGGRPAFAPASGPVPWPQLRAAAHAVARRAYAPWSGLAVGAAGLTDDGRIVTGTNVENASYGLTLCAECGVVSELRSRGAMALIALSVVTADGRPLAPCGRCRQLLLDNGGPDLRIDAGPDREPVRLDALLPGAFDAATLIQRRER
jgi:homotetrameric cytidine deaminase